MVGGERNDQRIVAALQRVNRAGNNGRAGIAPHRLEQDIRLDSDCSKLLGD